MNLHAYNHIGVYKPRCKMLGRGTNTIAYPNGKDENTVIIFTIDRIRLEYLREIGMINGYEYIKSLKIQKHGKIFEHDLYKAVVPRLKKLERYTQKWHAIIILVKRIHDTYIKTFNNNNIGISREDFWLELTNDEFPECIKEIANFAINFGAWSICPDFSVGNFLLWENKIVPYDCIISENALYNFVYA